MSVDGKIVSANDLSVDDSEALAGQNGGFNTISSTTPGLTNSGRSFSSFVLAGSTVANNSASESTIAASTFTPGAASLGSSSLQHWSTGSTGSIGNNTAYIVVNGASSATVTASFP